MKEIEEFKELEKIELHAHLNGCIPTNIIQQLVLENEISIPNGFNLDTDLQILKPANCLGEYFKPWEVFKKIPIGFKMLDIMVKTTLESLKNDNIIYVELRNSPFYISKLNLISLEESINWLIKAIIVNSRKVGIDARLILSITKHEYNSKEAMELLNIIQKLDSKIIVGVDLSGDEDIKIESDIVKFFRTAKDEVGLGISIHAGETGNPENIIWAIEECHADRIGHGTSVLKSQAALELIREKQVCLEVSLISNLRTGAISRIEEHPIKRLINERIPVTLCSDNPAVHGLTLSHEYMLLHSIFQDKEKIKQLNDNSRNYIFAKRRKDGSKIFNR